MWAILKVLIEFVTVLLLFYVWGFVLVWFFWLGGMWGLSSLTRDELAPPAMEGSLHH